LVSALSNVEESTILKHQSPSELFEISATSNAAQNISILFEIDSTKSANSNDANGPASLIRKATELALVLDVSGSMMGAAIDHAKRAMKQLVADLMDGDLLHIVVYSSEADVLFKNGGMEQIPNMLQAIDDVDAGGGTNMYAGLRKAYNILKKNRKTRMEEEGKIGMNQRVFLFSDGWVNTGDVQKDEDILNKVNGKKLKYGITTSSFGVGDDFNRPLLSNMSIVGEGDFFYIDDAESIERVVNIAKKSYRNTIATRTKLWLYGLDEHRYVINNVYGRGEIESNTAIIDINDIRADDKRFIVIAMAVNTTEVGESIGAVLEVLRWKLVYQTVQNGESVKQNIQSTVGLQEVASDSEIEINYDVMMHWELAEQRLEDILIFEEETVNGHMENAVARKSKLIDSIEEKCKTYQKGEANELNEDTTRLLEVELRRHKQTLQSLRSAMKTNSPRERRRAALKHHADYYRNVNSSSFHDEL